MGSPGALPVHDEHRVGSIRLTRIPLRLCFRGFSLLYHSRSYVSGLGVFLIV